MADERRTATVAELQQDRILFVEDGNHGEYRPLAHEFADEGTPFIRPDDLNGGRVNFAECDHINQKAFDRVRKGKGRAGDIVFTHRATVGRIARVGPNAPEFVANPGVTVWRCTAPNVLDPTYLYFFMQTPAFMDQVWAEAGNTDTFPYVSLTQQRSLLISIPCIERQRAIAHVLGSLDDKIELNRRMNETLEAMARALFKSWFVDFDPVRAKAEGRSPCVPDTVADSFPSSFKKTELGEIPSDWRIGQLQELASVFMGLSPDGDSYNGDGIGTPLINGPVEFGEYFPVRSKWTTSPSRLAEFGDLVLCVRGSTTGRRVVADGVYCLGRGVCALRSATAPRAFLYQLVNNVLQRLLAKTTGSVFPSLSAPDIKGFLVLIPSPEALAVFGRITQPIVERIEADVVASKTLALLRDSLLPKLISGELRVKAAEKIVEAVA